MKNLGENQILMTAVPGLYYRLMKTDTSTRVLANPQLRTQVGLTAQAKFGDEVPVPVTTFSPIAAGGVNQQPITSYNYRTIGVNIEITPRAHLDNDVTLTLKLQVNSISGTGFGGLPTFGNREVTTQIRLECTSTHCAPSISSGDVSTGGNPDEDPDDASVGGRDASPGAGRPDGSVVGGGDDPAGRTPGEDPATGGDFCLVK